VATAGVYAGRRPGSALRVHGTIRPTMASPDTARPAGSATGPRPVRRPRTGEFIDRPTKRRAGVWRRAFRRETSRLNDGRRLAAILLLAVIAGVFAAGLLARGEAAGADARAYWAGVRIWLNGGDPYHPSGPFLPYVYAPWMLPVFAPWALLPWDVAWFVWRGGTILVLFWTVHWAYRQRPLPTALATAVLAFPIAANLDTGNVSLLLTLMLWGAQFTGPRLAGLLWGLATWLKWIPAPLILVLQPRARGWGILWLGAAIALSLVTLPLTIAQFRALFGFGARPLRLDYLVVLWATIPWFWRHPEPLWWLRPRSWPAGARALRTRAGAWLRGWRSDPAGTAVAIRRQVARGVQSFLGLGAGAPAAGVVPAAPDRG
jgi:hypothetical protein